MLSFHCSCTLLDSLFSLKIITVLRRTPVILTQLLLLFSYNSLSSAFGAMLELSSYYPYLKNYIFMYFCPAYQLNFNSQRQNCTYFFLPPVWYLDSLNYGLKVQIFIEHATGILEVYHTIESL